MKKYIGILSIVLVFGACSDAQKEGDLSSELDKALKNVSLDANEFSGKLDELLTLEMAAKCSELPKDLAKINYNKFTKSPEMHSLRYDWESDRVRTIEFSGRSIEVPMTNSIELSWVKASTPKEFTANYHNPTKEEMENAKNAMKAKENELVKEGIVTKDQVGMADDMATSMMENYKVIDVPNLGDKAAWIQRKMGNELKVLYRGVEFQLTIDLSDDENANKAKSIELARQIIDEKLR